MEYQFSVTLKKIQITNPNLRANKVIASLTQGNVTKRISNPRFIRNSMGNFFLQRLTIVSQQLTESNSKALLQIWMLNTSGQQEIGNVQFDVVQMAKDSERPGAKAQYVCDRLENIVLEYDVLLQRNPVYEIVDHEAEMQNIETQAIKKFNLREIDRPYLSPTLRPRRVDIGDVRSNASPSKLLKDDESSQGDIRTQRSERVKVVRSGSNPNRMAALVARKLQSDSINMTPNKNQHLNTNSSTQKKEPPNKNELGDRKQRLVPQLKIGSMDSLNKTKAVEANPQYLFDTSKFKAQNIKDMIRRERQQASMDVQASSSSIGKRKGLQIEIIQYEPNGQGPSMARKVQSHQEPPVVPNILISTCSPKLSLSARVPPLAHNLARMPKKSSLRRNSLTQSNISSSGKKHVRYSAKVDITEVQAKIKKLEQHLTKKDIMYNVLYGMGAMAVGIIMGMY